MRSKDAHRTKDREEVSSKERWCCDNVSVQMLKWEIHLQPVTDLGMNGTFMKCVSQYK